MSRDDEQRLRDILDAIGRIRDYRSAVSDELDGRTRDGIFYTFVVIGEAANALAAELTAAEPGIEWRNIVGLRNFLAHRYFDIDLQVIEEIILLGLGPLELAVKRMLGA